MANILTFAFKTIPDVATGRRLYELDGLSDKEVANIMFHLRRQETSDTDNLRPHLQRIVTISAVLRTENEFKLWALGAGTENEKTLIEELFSCIDQYSTDLVSWDASQLDLSILHYRTLLHGVSAPGYWKGIDGAGTWHLELAESFACMSAGLLAPLDEVATMLGFTGASTGRIVNAWDSYQAGDIKTISNHCDENTLKIYLVYLRHQLMTGNLTQSLYQDECGLVRETLAKTELDHIHSFLDNWS